MKLNALFSIHKKTSNTFCYGKIYLYLLSNKVHSNATSTIPYDLSRFFFNLTFVFVLRREREKMIDQQKEEEEKNEEKYLFV